MHFLASSALFGTEQVTSAKLLGVIFNGNLSFDERYNVAIIYAIFSDRRIYRPFFLQ